MEAVQRIQVALTQAPMIISLVLGAVIPVFTYTLLSAERPHAGFPFITSDNEQFKGAAAWVQDGRAVLAKGLRECSSCFQVLTGSGYRIVVPNRFADELRHHRDLRSTESLAKDFFSTYPGFEGIREGERSQSIMLDVIRGKLTQNLALVLDDVVKETNNIVGTIFGEDSQWQAHPMKQHVLDIIARLVTRVFQGEPICHDKNWLRIAKDYTVHVFTASRELAAVHPLIRPFKHWTMPVCKSLRNDVREARQILKPEIERRRRKAESMLQAGKKPPKVADVVGWMVELIESTNQHMDYVAAQLFLFVVAIHSTSETLSNCIIELCDSPEAVQMLREEIVRVLREDGWSKNSLYKMKLLDSFLKETLRLNPALDSEFPLSPHRLRLCYTSTMLMSFKQPCTALQRNPSRFPTAQSFQQARV